jgi:hypothetical protein
MDKIRNQEGSSFTESLITVVVAGVACVAFISVVASLVRETKNREINEMMSNHAFEGLSQVRFISSYGLSEDVMEALESGMKCGCAMKGSHDHPDKKDKIEVISTHEDIDCTEEGSECEKLDLSEEEDEFFYRKVELQLEGVSENGVAKVTVEVGRANPTGNSTLDTYSIDGFISTK